jgi:hypothetical protein
VSASVYLREYPKETAQQTAMVFQPKVKAWETEIQLVVSVPATVILAATVPGLVLA